MPQVTVLMPVYNREEYIADAVTSVLKQTFRSFRLFILDDGSTDRTVSIIRRFNDPRIVLKRMKHDYINTLNKGLELVDTPYFARMDADDIMPKERLAIQVSLMNEFPEIDICGGWMTVFGKGIAPTVKQTLAGYIKEPLVEMLRGNILFNPTTMCRTAFFHRHDIHYKRYVHAEDMQFWCDAAKHGAGFFVESQILNYYRHRQEQISCVYNQEQQTTALTIRAECLEWLMIHRIHDTDIHAFYQAAGTLKNKAYLNDMPYYAMFYNLIKEYISNQSRL